MSGGSFEVQGSIGQHAAGPATGGKFAVEGIHWGMISVVQTESGPQLEVLRDRVSGTLTIRWPLSPDDSWRLEASTTLGQEPSQWEEVPSNTHQSNRTHRFITIRNPVGRRFYRLAKP